MDLVTVACSGRVTHTCAASKLHLVLLSVSLASPRLYASVPARAICARAASVRRHRSLPRRPRMRRHRKRRPVAPPGRGCPALSIERHHRVQVPPCGASWGDAPPGGAGVRTVHGPARRRARARRRVHGHSGRWLLVQRQPLRVRARLQRDMRRRRCRLRRRGLRQCRLLSPHTTSARYTDLHTDQTRNRPTLSCGCATMFPARLAGGRAARFL